MMNPTESVMHYKKYLKRKNYSNHTIKNYLNRLKHSLVWLPVPLESSMTVHVKHYIDIQLAKRLGPQTIDAHLVVIRSFYYFIQDEEGLTAENSVSSGVYGFAPSRSAPPAPSGRRDCRFRWGSHQAA
jgi:site-specific recombinase XerD